MSENTKEQAPTTADVSHEVKQLEEAILYFTSKTEQERVDGKLSYINFDDKLETVLQAAQAHLEAAPVLDELIEARKKAAKGCGEGKWYLSHHPNNSGTALINDGLEHGMFAIEAEWPEANFIKTAANALQKLIESNGVDRFKVDERGKVYGIV